MSHLVTWIQWINYHLTVQPNSQTNRFKLVWFYPTHHYSTGHTTLTIMEPKESCSNKSCACGGNCTCEPCTCVKAETESSSCTNPHCKCTSCGCGSSCVCNVPGIEDWTTKWPTHRCLWPYHHILYLRILYIYIIYLVENEFIRDYKSDKVTLNG